jgi:hypothetical protein
MTEAHNGVHLTQLRTRLHIATAVIARRAAIRETKAAMQRQGRKPATIPHRDIVAAANEYLRNHRAQCIEEAQVIVARWQAEGVFGPRGGIRSPRASLSSSAQRAKA